MGLWGKVKGVFGRIGRGIVNTAKHIISNYGAPIGAAIGSFVGGPVGTKIGGMIGGIGQKIVG